MSNQQIIDELEARGQVNIQFGLAIWSQDEGNPSLYNRWFVIAGVLRRVDSKMLPADVCGDSLPNRMLYCGILPREWFGINFPSLSLN